MNTVGAGMGGSCASRRGSGDPLLGGPHLALATAVIALGGCASDPELVDSIDTTGETRLVHFEMTNADDECVDMRLFFDDTLLIEGTVDDRGSAHCFSTHVVDTQLPIGEHQVRVESDVPSSLTPLTVTIDAETYIALAFADSGLVVSQETGSTLGRCR